MKPRVHYFCLISTDQLNQQYRTRFHVGPATRKVVGTAAALISAGTKAVIVSALIPVELGMALCSVERVGKIPYVRLFAKGRGAGRRLSASISYLWYAMSTVRPGDVVLLYNAFPDYILAALFLFFARRPAVLDVEDAPRPDEKGLRGAMNTTSFRILRTLCAPKAVTVSKVVGRSLGFTKFYVNYGVSSALENCDATPTDKFAADVPLSILYGGAIMPETGLNLFCATVRQLAQQHPHLKLTFHITGLFDPTIFHALRTELPAEAGVQIIIHGELSSAQYKSLLRSMDVGLCLKLPSHSMGQTTFPSKVVEICAAGMLLCTTSVSDVPDLFNSDIAVILATEQPGELLDALVAIDANKAQMRLRAQRGQQMVSKHFSEVNVGQELRAFLLEESDRR